MSNVLTIFKKEFKSYFSSPLAYVVLTVFLLIVGWFFANGLFENNTTDMRQVFTLISFAYLFFVPALAMRLLAEERKTGTLELLVTLPTREMEIILGKFLAAWALLAIALIFTLFHLATLDILGKLDYGVAIGGYVGLLLVGGAYLAIGIFISSLTENQIVAFIITLALVMILFFLDKVLVVMPPAIVSVVEYLGPDFHYGNMARGVVDSRDLIYLGSLIFLGLYLAARSLKSRKWG